MGRAIDMEKDIDALKLKVEKLDNTVRGMVSKLDELNEKSTKTKHIDLTEVNNDKKETKKTNNKRDAKRDEPSSDDGGASKKKNN
tara:strand:+ start:1016 stop:1270 length:255 start_codon:yes stop_codon:yes gene_type:complete